MSILKTKYIFAFFSFFSFTFLLYGNLNPRPIFISHNFWNIPQGSGICLNDLSIKKLYQTISNLFPDKSCKKNFSLLFCKVSKKDYFEVRSFLLKVINILCPPKLTFKFYTLSKKIKSALFFQNKYFWGIVYISSVEIAKKLIDYKYSLSIYIISKDTIEGDIIYDAYLNKIKKEKLIDF